MSGIPASARPHHWGFVNAWLRSSFQRIPETIVSAIARSRSAAPVVDAWQNFAKTLDEEDRLPPDGLEASAYTASSDQGDWYVAVVSFPPPEATEEAHMAALCVRPPDGQLRPEEREQRPDEIQRAGEEEPPPEEANDQEAEEREVGPAAETRYILLERTDDATQLVEWTGNDREVVDAPDGGNPPAADEKSFVRAVNDLL